MYFDPVASSDIGFVLSGGVYGDTSPITISTDFLDSINFIISNRSNETIIDQILMQYLEAGPAPGTVNFAPQTSDDFETSSVQVSEIVSTTISIVLADILSSISKNGGPILINSANQTNRTYIDLGTQYGNFAKDVTIPIPSDTSDPVRVGFEVSRYGYMSGNRSRIMTFAIAVNLIYMVTNIIYLVVFVLIFPYLGVKPVANWTAIEELLVLAFLSRKPRELDNGGAGVWLTQA